MKDVFFTVVIGTFIGYMLFAFINGLTNDLAYRTGLVAGAFILKILEIKQ